jgi:hypothetical protein
MAKLYLVFFGIALAASSAFAQSTSTQPNPDAGSPAGKQATAKTGDDQSLPKGSFSLLLATGCPHGQICHPVPPTIPGVPQQITCSCL